MSAGFAGSVVLQQNSTGVSSIPRSPKSVLTPKQQHTSQSGFNLCTAQVIRQYLANLTLPEPGTVCQPDSGIWSPPSNSSLFAARSVDKVARDPMSLESAVEAFARSGIVKKSMALGPKVKRSL